jgi:hypothetical protein
MKAYWVKRRLIKFSGYVYGLPLKKKIALLMTDLLLKLQMGAQPTKKYNASATFFALVKHRKKLLFKEY